MLTAGCGKAVWGGYLEAVWRLSEGVGRLSGGCGVIV